MSDTRMVGSQTLVTMKVAGQPFGIPVEAVRDILDGQRISRIPLAPKSIAGSLNLRGRIVTVLDVRVLLGLDAVEAQEKAMNVVIAHDGELYSLLVDQVGDVLAIGSEEVEAVPQTVMPSWRSVSSGIVKLKNELVLILITKTLLQIAGLAAVEE